MKTRNLKNEIKKCRQLYRRLLSLEIGGLFELTRIQRYKRMLEYFSQVPEQIFSYLPFTFQEIAEKKEKINSLNIHKIKDYSGHDVLVDISDSICMNWGVKVGMRISTPLGDATVEGVGKNPYHLGLQMWFTLDTTHKAHYLDWWNNADLKSVGITILN